MSLDKIKEGIEHFSLNALIVGPHIRSWNPGGSFSAMPTLFLIKKYT